MSRLYMSPCLFNFYAEYIMRNTGLEETQARIKIARRNINNLRYGDDTTPVAESEEELKTLSMKVKKESEKAGLKLSIQKLRSRHLFPSLHGKQKGTKILFSWAPKSLQMVTTVMKLKDACSLEEMNSLDSILKSRDITLPTKVHLVKAMVFPVVMYGCEIWTVKKAER